jgi:NAD(P)-dependent dehydrogenase (short-subunit alcohol dehydrogenase family)
LGRATAEAFARKGGRHAVLDLDDEGAARVASHLSGAPTFHADVADELAMREAVLCFDTGMRRRDLFLESAERPT